MKTTKSYHDTRHGMVLKFAMLYRKCAKIMNIGTWVNMREKRSDMEVVSVKRVQVLETRKDLHKVIHS